MSEQPLKLADKFSVKKARRAQVLLCQKIVTENRLPSKIKFVAGVDVSYIGSLGIGSVAVLDSDSLEVLETQTAIATVKIPYIPTLLSFREIPPAIACIKKLKLQPDVLLVDGQGFAHPLRCGLASHLGIALGKATIGVAKKRLIGRSVKIVDEVYLVDNDQIIGAEVKTKQDCKPVYVSVGHLVSLSVAIDIVKHCARSRIPEPILQAHKLSTKESCKLAFELAK
jgi:deoxyribonuclease V